MATEFTWRVNGLMVENQGNLNNVAVMSNFQVSGVDGDQTASVQYSVNLLPADAQNFTPYNNITEQQAIDWTKDALGEDRVNNMQQEVQDQIDKQRIPTPQPAPLPW